MALMELADETNRIITGIFSGKGRPSQPISDEEMNKIQEMLEKAIHGVTDTKPIKRKEILVRILSLIKKGEINKKNQEEEHIKKQEDIEELFGFLKD